MLPTTLCGIKVMKNVFDIPKSSFGEHTFPRLAHAGLGNSINEDNTLLSMHDVSLG